MAELSIPDMENKALALLRADADKIYKLIDVQMENLTMPQCPLYEEVLDTQMFGLSREVEFAVRLGLLTDDAGREIVGELERKLAELYEKQEQIREG